MLAFSAVAGLWVALAWWRPTTTWHLAPVLLAVAPGFTRLTAGAAGDANPAFGRRALGRRLGPAVLGAAGSVLVGAALDGAGHLAGPTLTGNGTTFGESVVAACLGALASALLPVPGPDRLAGEAPTMDRSRRGLR